MDSYDVIVIGAGPAGGQCARELSESGFSVLLLERSKIIGEPNFSSGGTVKEILSRFNLPKKVAQREWDTLSIVSPNDRVDFCYNRPMGYVLDYKTLKQYLAKEVKTNGSNVITGVNVTDVVTENGKMVGVKFGDNIARSKIIIDATGSSSALATKAGLIKNKGEIAVGIEHLMSNVKLVNGRALEFYLGDTFAPGGYAWLFPTKRTEAKVGVARIGKKNHILVNKLKAFIKSNTQTKDAKVIGVHGGSIFMNGGIKNHVNQNFMAIGDAAGQCNPWGGEGIRHAMLSGRFAATVCKEFLNCNGADYKILEKYNALWKGYVKNKWKISLLLQKFIYNRMSDSFANKLVELSKMVRADDIFRILFYYEFGKIKKYWREMLTHVGVVV